MIVNEGNKGGNNDISKPTLEAPDLDDNNNNNNNNSKVISDFVGEHRNSVNKQKGTSLDESHDENAKQKSSFDLNGNEETVLDRNH